MISVSDILKLLEQVPIWKRIRGLPSEIEALNRRVDALEKALAEMASKPPRPAAELCPICREGDLQVKSVRKHRAFGLMGVQEHTLTCGACGHTEERMVDPLNAIGHRG